MTEQKVHAVKCPECAIGASVSQGEHVCNQCESTFTVDAEGRATLKKKSPDMPVPARLFFGGAIAVLAMGLLMDVSGYRFSFSPVTWETRVIIAGAASLMLCCMVTQRMANEKRGILPSKSFRMAPILRSEQPDLFRKSMRVGDIVDGILLLIVLYQLLMLLVGG